MEISDKYRENWKNRKITYRPIGIIYSEHTEHENTPVQGIFTPAPGRIEVFEEFSEGLNDIDRFTHLYLIYHFDRATGSRLLQKPFLDGQKERGIFAIRHFNRPNPIGLSIVGLTRVCGNFLEVTGVDILDGTPLLDIKPYIRQFDTREDAKSGWVDEQRLDDIGAFNGTPKELRKRESGNRAHLS
jgi:tRNA-Thr(GGU) m(6)t(6)A37 methyltransferase TsaA